MSRADGTVVEGTRGVGLCPGCDRDDRDAHGVLAFFTVHDLVTDDDVSSLAALLEEWVQRIVKRFPAEDTGWSDDTEDQQRDWLDGNF